MEDGMITFFIPCNPPTVTSQQKGAFATGKGIRFFKKARVKQAENNLFALLQPHVPAQPVAGPLVLSVKWCFPWRKSESKKRRALGAVPCDVRPDLSNIIKLLEDTMTTLRFWEDDSQVADLRLSKWWGDEAGITISIEAIDLGPKCKCGKAGKANHTCPFAVEIYDDRKSMCNCCDECAGECAMSV
jgi:Holliday junction resolvase RusA-like endonuclease